MLAALAVIDTCRRRRSRAECSADSWPSSHWSSALPATWASSAIYRCTCHLLCFSGWALLSEIYARRRSKSILHIHSVRTRLKSLNACIVTKPTWTTCYENCFLSDIGLLSMRYDTIYLRALKSWRYGQLSLAHGTNTKNEGNTKNKNRFAQKNGAGKKKRWGQFAFFPQDYLYGLGQLRTVFSRSTVFAFSYFSLVYYASAGGRLSWLLVSYWEHDVRYARTFQRHATYYFKQTALTSTEDD